MAPLPLTLSETHHALDRLRLEMCELLTHANTFAPIFRLPSEILSSILLILMSDCMRPWLNEVDSSKAPGIQPYSWVVYTHICRRWREIALRYPVLWSSLIIHQNLPPEAMETIILRSGSMPLRIVIYSWDNKNPRNLAAALEQLDRTEVFICRDEVNVATFPQLEKIDISDAPILRRLSLLGLSLWDTSYHATLPTLEALEELEYHELPPHGFAFLHHPTLTQLIINFSTENDSAQVLLQTLRGLERLQFLKVNQVMMGQEPIQTEYQPWVKVVLPHMRRLELSAVNTATAWDIFLLHLTVPLTTRFSITLFTTSNTTVPVLSYLQDRLDQFDYSQSRPGGVWPFTSFAIERRRTVLWSTDNDDDCTGVSSRPVRFPSHRASEHAPWDSFIYLHAFTDTDAVLSSFRQSLGGVRALYYKCDLPEDDAIRASLSHMRLVETLCIHPETSISKDLQAPSSLEESLLGALFPKLRTLIILCRDPDRTVSDWKSWWRGLIDALASRMYSDDVAPVETLILILPETLGMPIEMDVEEALGVVSEFVEIRACAEWQERVLGLLRRSGCPRDFADFVYFKGRIALDGGPADVSVDGWWVHV
ncbi:hypothetical protein EUX98_g2905 [Antrodiella citrinella]|uniref:Uncharacterized protein n=1 Tax=Antrodiella citrinella TaxID=2447956 RepID=A0A4S4MZZ2_9APHY|nr:hypothetical protein EUX98_g2905 [Antrodiella citrinella]